MGELEARSRVVFDTDVLVNHLRGKSEVLLKSKETAPATTIINAFELYYGVFKSSRLEANLSKTNTLLSSLDVLPLDLGSAEAAGKVLAGIRQRREDLEMRDLLIGCIVRERGFSLVTNNAQHFRRIPGLSVIDASQMADR